MAVVIAGAMTKQDHEPISSQSRARYAVAASPSHETLFRRPASLAPHIRRCALMLVAPGVPKRHSLPTMMTRSPGLYETLAKAMLHARVDHVAGRGASPRQRRNWNAPHRGSRRPFATLGEIATIAGAAARAHASARSRPDEVQHHRIAEIIERPAICRVAAGEIASAPGRLRIGGWA